MKKLLMINFYFFFFIFAFIFLTPKENLYYFAEQELEKLSVVVDNEKVDDKGFTLAIEKASLYVKGIPSAKIALFELNTYLFYNSVEIKDIELADTLKSFVPLKINYVSATQAIYNPLVIQLKASGGFGEAWGSVNLQERKLKVNVTPSKLLSSKFRSTMRMMKKDKTGGYVYELTF